MDITAHAIRAIATYPRFAEMFGGNFYPTKLHSHVFHVERGVAPGFAFIERHQRPDGSWVPLWFGNQDHPDEENPIYGTAKVLMAYRDTGRRDTLPAQRGFNYLIASQNTDGGWGGGASVRNEGRTFGDQVIESTVEETALAVEALLAAYGDGKAPIGGTDREKLDSAVVRGVAWLCHAVENGRLLDPAPIGFYFAKLWYYERLYPLVFTVSALGRALRTQP